MARATDVILLADETGRSVPDAAAAYFAMGQRFGFGRLDAMLLGVQTTDYYESLALQKARDSLEAGHRDLSRALLVSSPNGLDLAAWESASGGRIDAAAQQIERILADGRASTAKLTVAASLVSELARQS
jgi:glutamate dehydrogenase